MSFRVRVPEGLVPDKNSGAHGGCCLSDSSLIPFFSFFLPSMRCFFFFHTCMRFLAKRHLPPSSLRLPFPRAISGFRSFAPGGSSTSGSSPPRRARSWGPAATPSATRWSQELEHRFGPGLGGKPQPHSFLFLFFVFSFLLEWAQPKVEFGGRNAGFLALSFLPTESFKMAVGPKQVPTTSRFVFGTKRYNWV